MKNLPYPWHLPIMKEEANIIMNLMKCRSQGIWVWFLHLFLKSGKEFTFVMCHSYMLIMPLVVPMIIITLHTNEHGIYKLFTWHAYMAPLFMLLHYEKKGVLQLALNSIFELHWTFATHYIYTSWVLMDKLHEL
jgi:hypothetical protein